MHSIDRRIPTRTAPPAFRFGPFQLLVGQRLLLAGGQKVRIGSRVMDVLLILVEASGCLVSKEELTARAWAGTTVEEGALRVSISLLRKALGEGSGERYVVNVPGRGYAFVAPVSFLEEDPPHEAARPPSGSLARGTWVPVGRDAIIGRLTAELPTKRFVTIVGPGGVGKTTVAAAVVDAYRANHPDMVHFVDLAGVPQGQDVPTSLSRLLDIDGDCEDPAPAVVAHLRGRKVLLVLDNCEHVIEPVAALAELLVERAPGIRILSTSREPLRARGEWVRRLPPLGVPPEDSLPGLGEALRFAAVELFVERAMASHGDFMPEESDGPAIAALCRSLDGIPLAIELAAARIEEFGLAGLAARLGDRFALLTRGRRTALSRQRTLSEAMDWSYRLLCESERAVLRRISCFAGGFSREAAMRVAAFGQISRSEALEALAGLVSKSLVSAEQGGRGERYRLLHMTRDYAREKLRLSGEHGVVSIWKGGASLRLEEVAHLERLEPACIRVLGSGWCGGGARPARIEDTIGG